jgi:hypothetical protein
MNVARRYSVFFQRDRLFTDAAAKLEAKSEQSTPDVSTSTFSTPNMSRETAKFNRFSPMDQNYSPPIPNWGLIPGAENMPTGQSWTATMRYVYGHER